MKVYRIEDLKCEYTYFTTDIKSVDSNQTLLNILLESKAIDDHGNIRVYCYNDCKTYTDVLNRLVNNEYILLDDIENYDRIELQERINDVFNAQDYDDICLGLDWFMKITCEFDYETYFVNTMHACNWVTLSRVVDVNKLTEDEKKKLVSNKKFFDVEE